jgi:hypothetical protein
MPWTILAVAAAVAPFLVVLSRGDTAWIGNQGDAKIIAWYLDDVATALRHGHLALTTTDIDHPAGVSLLWNTSVLLLAIVATPLTLSLGPLLTYNLLVVAGVGLSTLAAVVALRRFTDTPEAAALGGFVYGVSPFVAGQTMGHLQMSFAVYPPLVLLIVERVVRGGRSPWRWGAVLGVLTAAQLLIGEEMVLLTAFGAGLALAVAALQHRDAVRACLPRLVRLTAAAALAGGILAAPLLAFQFAGPGHARSAMTTYLLNADAAGAVIPTPTRLLAPGWSTAAVSSVSITADDADAYLGIPLLLLVGFRGRALLADARARFALATGAAAFVLSLGDTLRVAGHSAGVPLPWAVLDHLPLVRDAAPARMAVVVDLMLAVVIAVTLEQLRRSSPGPGRAASTALLAVAVAGLLPAVPAASTPDTTPAFFTADAQRLPAGASVLVTPWPDSNGSEAMLWQMRAGLRFSMPVGEAYGPGATLDGQDSLLHTTLVDIERRGLPLPQLGAQTRAQLVSDLRSLQVDAIVVGPSAGAARVEALFTDLLGRSADHAGGVAVWWSVAG